MSATPATIQVTFTANYIGQHRVCYRMNNTGAYTCITVSCAGGGAPCTADIPIVVDNETCTPVEFDGYVQAICEDINSTQGRVPFSVTFTPTPSCRNYDVTCNNAGVASITVEIHGSGYNPAAPPTVVLTGGGGAGATAVAVVGTGAITTTTISFTSTGSGYINGTYTNVPLLGGAGSGAKATITVAGGIAVSGVVTTPGTGYLTGNTLTPDPTAMGGATPLTNITFNVNSDYGKIIAVNITSNGTGYTSNPTVTIAPPGGGGQQATGTAILDFCPGFTAPGCSASGLEIPNGVVQVGQTISVCTNTGTAPSVPDNYTLVQNGDCLCGCVSTTIASTGGSPGVGAVNYWYTACNGALVQGTVTTGGSPSSVTVCIAHNSLLTQAVNGATASVTENGGC